MEDRFSYTNTYYDRDPNYDLSRPDESEFGKCDFVICRDVLEYVPEPIDGDFAILSRLLKPTGILILTVPYSLEPAIIKHYPALAETGFAEIGGRPVLVAHSARLAHVRFDLLGSRKFGIV